MDILVVLLGLVAGFFAGVCVAALAQVKSDRQAVSDGVIKLCGSIYKLDKIEM